VKTKHKEEREREREREREGGREGVEKLELTKVAAVSCFRCKRVQLHYVTSALSCTVPEPWPLIFSAGVTIFFFCFVSNICLRKLCSPVI
jgi:hypothetical protein